MKIAIYIFFFFFSEEWVWNFWFVPPFFPDGIFWNYYNSLQFICPYRSLFVAHHFLKVSRLKTTYFFFLCPSLAHRNLSPCLQFTLGYEKLLKTIQEHFAAISTLRSVCLTDCPQGSWLRSLYTQLPQVNLVYFQNLCHLDLDPWSGTQGMATHQIFRYLHFSFDSTFLLPTWEILFIH